MTSLTSTLSGSNFESTALKIKIKEEKKKKRGYRRSALVKHFTVQYTLGYL